MDTHYELCFQQLEFAGHLLWECPFARNVWALCLAKIQKCANEATDFFLLFQVLAKRISKPELEKWATISWGIWNARNKFYFEKIHMPIPKPSRTGLLFSCMNTRTLWLHKEILDTHCRVLLLHAVGTAVFFPLHWFFCTGYLLPAACGLLFSYSIPISLSALVLVGSIGFSFVVV